MSGTKQYEEYKDSGIEWVGPIPVTWETVPLFAVVRENTASNKAGVESNLLSLSYGRIVRKNIEANDGLLPASFDTYQVISRNDIVLRLTDLQNDKRSLRSAISPERGIITSAYLAVTPTHILPNFLSYLLRAYDLQKVFYAMGGGLRQSMKFSDMKWLPLVVPPALLQESITAYLDRETAQIDDLIGKQERLIELLAEKRQAIITHAVTNGLDPSAPTKHSGIFGVGDVPRHWKIGSVKNFAISITDGAHISPDLEDGQFDFVSTRDVSDDGIDFVGSLKTSASSYEYLVRTGCRPSPGDLLFTKDGTIGRTTVVKGEHDFVVASSLVIITPDAQKISSDYFDLVCRSKSFQEQVSSYARGAGLPRLSIANLRRIGVAVPPRDEQLHILSTTLPRLDSIRTISEQAAKVIALLTERRSALISAAVTGKIKVDA